MSKKLNKICVVGLGYIGLPTAAVIAETGIEVIGYDVSQKIVDTINAGRIHIVEPGLADLVYKVVSSRKLVASVKPEEADAFIIAVPTPINEQKAPDLSYVMDAIEKIAPLVNPGNTIIIESTISIGSTELVRDYLGSLRPDLIMPETDSSNIYIAHCPERVLPGNVIREIKQNYRIIGGITPACSAAAAIVYNLFVSRDSLLTTSCKIAEMCKLAENSFRDVNIAFANELSILADEADVNVWELIDLANRHPRVNILQPGPGVGGHCIAIDPWFLVNFSPDTAKLISTARKINDAKPEWVLLKIFQEIHKISKTKKNNNSTEVSIALYGVTFKPDIDDIRESPALQIAQAVKERHSGAIYIIEPNLDELPESLFSENVVKCSNIEADIHVMLVDHSPFKTMPLPKGTLIDTRGIWSI